MPFARPSLADLISRAASDIEAELPGTDARLRRSNLGAIARVHAAGVHGLYGYLDYLARQLMVDTAETDYLDRWAGIWGVVRLAAVQAEGQAMVVGANGSVVASGAVLTRADGTQFQTVGSQTVSAGNATLTVRAIVAGAAGNCASGTALSFVEPVGGVNGVAYVVSSGVVGGEDAETDDRLRARVLLRLQKPPMGGAAADYVAWALEVPGVTRAWVYPLAGGAGTVTVRFVRDGDVSPIPSSGEVADVQAYINARRPVTATVTVSAPTELALNPEISITPDTAAVRAAVQAELLDFLQREGAPGARLYISRLRETVSGAAGEADNTVVSPSADLTPTSSQLVVLGTITWS